MINGVVFDLEGILVKLPPRDVLVVGDRESDEAAARKVGCEFVKVEK